VVEIAAVDLIGHEIVPIGSSLVRPPIPIPPQASAIHHIRRCGRIGSSMG
jgi:DNA polymerase III epsilon subunit-like protein